jgi:two-component system cell cycle response regulator
MSARVLVVDDVEVNVKLLEAKLAAEYFTVLTAPNGRVALEIAARELPDIVLLDVMMPQMDGFEVCRRLKADARTSDIPVVMVTALSDVADRLRGLEAGADDFLTKPVNDIALFARVRSLVRLKRMMEEWKLREEVCGRFATLPGGEAKAVEEDLRPARIVLLEDNPGTAAKIADTLAPMTAELIRVEGCGAALERVSAADELLIASLSVEEGDPLRLVSSLRANEATRQIPILLIAEEGELPRLAKGLDLGANDYLLRPADKNELIARARTQIRRHRLNERLKQHYQKSLSLALTDELTGLYNRRYVAAHLDSLMSRERDGAKGPAVLMFDIDHFKLVNDRNGHAVGDEVLVEIAKRAMHGVRNFDLVARYGGEEFLVVMPETTLAIAMAVGERLRRAVADAPFPVSGPAGALPVTVSVGVACALDAGDTPAALLRRADEALYAAKARGRNRVVAWPVPTSDAA